MDFVNENMHSDLVIEYAERFYNSSEHDGQQLPGVEIEETVDPDYQIKVIDVKIVDAEGEKVIGKPMGRYITVEAMHLPDGNDDYQQAVTGVLCRQLQKLLPDLKDKKILVAGIGNREITPDALGPQVVQNLKITRHIIKEYGKAGMGKKKVHQISSLVPGVMAQTGMETMEIIRGVIRETDPDAVIAIDALAARSVRRLNCTIQITDTGINPGSGVCNHRCGLNEETLGIPVIGIGVPTVVDGATIVHDAIAHLLENLEEAEMEEFLQELITPRLHRMFVTPKDVDETVKRLSYTISEGINIAMEA